MKKALKAGLNAAFVYLTTNKKARAAEYALVSAVVVAVHKAITGNA